MKFVCFIILSLLLNVRSYAQSDPLDDSAICARFARIVNLIKSKNAKALSKLIYYPISRHYPLPSIKGPKDFIRGFDVLFDSAFISKLELYYNDSVIFQRHGRYGLVGKGGFAGDIWIESDGKIMAIHYKSDKAEKERRRLKDSIKREMHFSVQDWEENQIEASSKKYLIRIDWTGDSLRYACWNKPKTQKDPPDIVIIGGSEEAQGTMGGWIWTFVNKEWTYTVDQSDICESPEYCGLFLIITENFEVKYSARLTPYKR